MAKLNYKRTTGTKIFDTINIIVLLLFSGIMIYPLIYVFSISISSPLEVSLGHVFFLPKGFDLTAYRIVLATPSIWNAYKNTIIYVVLGTGFVLLFNTLAAYPLSQKNLYGRKVIMIYFTITMFFGGGLVPTYLLINYLNMIDTIWVMIIPGSVAAWNIIIFRTNFQNIPDSLIESVKIDGGNDFLIYRKIVLPLSKPILATIALFTIVGIWNNFFTALIYINDRKMIPLQNYLRIMIVNSNLEDIKEPMAAMGQESGGMGLVESIKMSAIIVSLGPILMIYPFIQKYFVKGALVGSIKG